MYTYMYYIYYIYTYSIYIYVCRRLESRILERERYIREEACTTEVGQKIEQKSRQAHNEIKSRGYIVRECEVNN